MSSKFSHCCSQLFAKVSADRGVLCVTWIRPLRIGVIGSLCLHICWLYFHPPQFYSVLLILFHITIALIILNECRRSAEYHQTLKDLGFSENGSPTQAKSE